MDRKPWPIIFLAFFFWSIPIFNIIGSYYLSGTEIGISVYLYSLISIPDNYISLFDIFFPAIIAGIAIFSVRSWSYPVFLMSMLWLTVRVLLVFSPNLNLMRALILIMVPMAVNIISVSYILLPSVRAAYFNPRLRWWESKPRYLINSDVMVDFAGESTCGEVTNISEGGVFLNISKEIKVEDKVTVTINTRAITVKLVAEVVYKVPDSLSYGLKFFRMSKGEKRALKKLTSTLKREGVETSRPTPIWTEDLFEWVKKLLTTGRGIVPELPRSKKS